MIYIQANQTGIIEVVSELAGYLQNPTLSLEAVPNDFYSNISSYIVQNGELVKVVVNPEDSFNYDLCSEELLKRFAYEAIVYCPAECAMIQLLVASKKKAFKAIAQANYTNKALNKYPIEIVDGIDIYDTYNRLNALFLEQGIDLESYLS